MPHNTKKRVINFFACAQGGEIPHGKPPAPNNAREIAEKRRNDWQEPTIFEKISSPVRSSRG